MPSHMDERLERHTSTWKSQDGGCDWAESHVDTLWRVVDKDFFV